MKLKLLIVGNIACSSADTSAIIQPSSPENSRNGKKIMAKKCLSHGCSLGVAVKDLKKNASKCWFIMQKKEKKLSKMGDLYCFPRPSFP
jgi:hypothetical protein